MNLTLLSYFFLLFIFSSMVNSQKFALTCNIFFLIVSFPTSPGCSIPPFRSATEGHWPRQPPTAAPPHRNSVNYESQPAPPGGRPQIPYREPPAVRVPPGQRSSAGQRVSAPQRSSSGQLPVSPRASAQYGQRSPLTEQLRSLLTERCVVNSLTEILTTWGVAYRHVCSDFAASGEIFDFYCKLGKVSPAVEQY